MTAQAEANRRRAAERRAEVVEAVEWGLVIGLDWPQIAQDAGLSSVTGLEASLRRCGRHDLASAAGTWVYRQRTEIHHQSQERAAA